MALRWLENMGKLQNLTSHRRAFRCNLFCCHPERSRGTFCYKKGFSLQSLTHQSNSQLAT
jgi:hypothetical protein